MELLVTWLSTLGNLPSKTSKANGISHEVSINSFGPSLSFRSWEIPSCYQIPLLGHHIM